jgi:alpha-tubulin suppressor-like RCC1 family protein
LSSFRRLGTRIHVLGGVAGLGLAAALAGGVAGQAGCDGSSSGDASGLPGDSGEPEATLEEDAGPASDGGGAGSGDGATTSATDAGSFTGLSCAVSPCAVSLAAGGGHICALLSDRTVRCWGQNASGELGFGGYDAGRTVPAQTPTPTPVAGVTGVTQVAAGGYSSGFGTTCAASSEAGVQCWGSNGDGVLGVGLAVDGGAPPAESIAPLPLALDSVAGLALGGFFGCALVSDGGVSCWGDNSENELGRVLDSGSFDPTPTSVSLSGAASAVAAGKYHACALLRDHSVECWGAAEQGQTGEVFDGGVASPRVVAGLEATQITAADGSTCAITTAGAVECWGGNQSGRLGRGNGDAANLAITMDPTPQPVGLPPGSVALQIASAVGSTCALLSDHTVWCWGDNAYGELGTGSAVPGFSASPAEVPGLANIIQVAAGPGGWTVCALLQEGSVRCWGVNNADQLGVDTSGDAGPDNSPHPVPVRVAF